MNAKTASYLTMGLGLIFSFYFHLIPLVLGACVAWLLLSKAQGLLRKVHNRYVAEASALLVNGVALLLVLGLLGFVWFYFRGLVAHGDSLAGAMAAAKEGLHSVQLAVGNVYPSVLDLDLGEQAIHWGRGHTAVVVSKGAGVLAGLAYVGLGFIVATLAFLATHRHATGQKGKAYPEEMKARLRLWMARFEQVFVSQFKISLLNTVLTAIFLLVVYPVFGVEIPFRGTLVLLTFCFGLIPVVGNLLSNTIILLLSFKVSVVVAGTSLLYLVVIHKLEYLFNAKIVGSAIRCSIWELIIAMLVAEKLFGIIGVVMAPLCYAYIKAELESLKII